MAAKDETTLTNRQREALGHFRDRESTKEVGEAMGISYNAANEHKRNLVKKGFLTKAGRGRSARKPTAPATRVTGFNGRIGIIEGLRESLRRTVDEANKALAAEQERMAELSAEQHALAQDMEAITSLRDDVDEREKALV